MIYKKKTRIERQVKCPDLPQSIKSVSAHGNHSHVKDAYYLLRTARLNIFHIHMALLWKKIDRIVL